VAKLIAAYQLPTPDFILSIQTGSDHNNHSLQAKSGTQIETERAIQSGLTTIAKITRK
jgi:hypothetical protein